MDCHSKSNCLEHATKDFAIRATADFSHCREKEPAQSWTYLGPTCCKVDATDPVRLL
jgi:hypothetical protein